MTGKGSEAGAATVDMLDFSTHVSYLGIIAILVFTGTGFPIPEEVPVMLAGIASHYGQLNPWLALAACLLGAVGGDCVMYAIGYHFGHNVLRDHPWFARFLKPDREAHIERMIHSHGVKVFFVARFLVGLRSPVFLTAGILRVPFRRFIVIDTVCAAIVVSFFFGLSFFFAAYIEELWKLIRNGQVTLTVVLVVAVAAVALLYFRRRWARHERVRQWRDKKRSLSARERAEENRLDEEKTVA